MKAKQTVIWLHHMKLARAETFFRLRVADNSGVVLSLDWLNYQPPKRISLYQYFSAGAEWRRQRKLYSYTFSKKNLRDHMFSTFETITDKLIKKIDGFAETGGAVKVVFVERVVVFIVLFGMLVFNVDGATVGQLYWDSCLTSAASRRFHIVPHMQCKIQNSKTVWNCRIAFDFLSRIQNKWINRLFISQ